MSYEKGLQAEHLAAVFLAQQGLQILHSNYRCKFGEIDLIAQDGATLCFVEVRFRASVAYGSPIDTIDGRKRRRILKTATHFLAYRLRGRPCACRFDIVTVEGTVSPVTRWWRAAFDASNDWGIFSKF